MAPSGRTVVSTTLIGVAVLIFVPVFFQAGAGFSYGNWTYGPQLQVVLENLPILLATAGLALLLAPLLNE